MGKKRYKNYIVSKKGPFDHNYGICQPIFIIFGRHALQEMCKNKAC